MIEGIASHELFLPHAMHTCATQSTFGYQDFNYIESGVVFHERINPPVYFFPSSIRSVLEILSLLFTY